MKRGGALRILLGLSLVVGMLGSVAPAANAAATRRITVRVASNPTTPAAASGSIGVTSSSSPSITSTCTSTVGCTYTFPRLATITLSASNVGGSTFRYWTNCTPTTANPCSISLGTDITVTATFAPPQNLTLTKGSYSSDGSTGTVTKTGSSWLTVCGAAATSCTASDPWGSSVTLTATPSGGSRFETWGASPCTSAPVQPTTGSSSCTVTMDQARTVTPQFRRLYDLAVTKSLVGNGTGTLTVGGVACSGATASTTCTTSHISTDNVTIVAAPNPGSKVTLGGSCSAALSASQVSCQVLMSELRTVTATFTSMETLTVAVAANGAGSVTSSPAGITDCDGITGTCSFSFLWGTIVQLTATNLESSAFSAWTDNCAALELQPTKCSLTMGGATTVTATFGDLYRLRVFKTSDGGGAGTGTVTATGIACGADCYQYFAPGTEVVLTAAATAGSRFGSWSGGCAETDLTGTTCTVTLASGSLDVTADFVKTWGLSASAQVSGSGVYGGSVEIGDVSVACSGNGCSVGSAYAATYDNGTSVTLVAVPATDTTVTWSGDIPVTCGIHATECTVTMSQARSITATFSRTQVQLSVSLSGSGAEFGSVVSAPAGIDCPSDCSSAFDIRGQVTLTATATVDAGFLGWTGACSESDLTTDTCTVTLDAATSVVASFVRRWPLTVVVSSDGTGTGGVTGPSGIDCPGTCSMRFDDGSQVELTAHPAANSMLGSWSVSGCASTSATCTVTMDQVRSVTATFTKLVYPLTVTKVSSKGGTGTVAVPAVNYTCGPTCTTPWVRNYDPGSSVTMTASPSATSWFVGWGGACVDSGTDPSCTVTVSDATSVSATFETKPVLTVTKAGVGSGTVTSTNLVGDVIDCGTDCTAAVITNAMVSLHAEPLASNESTFTGWTGTDCGASVDCEVSVAAAMTVTANFTAPTASISLQKVSQDSGSGEVVSDPPGISCSASGGSNCLRQAQVADFVVGTVVRLTARPASDSYFVGWGDQQCDSVSVDGKQCTITVGPASTTHAVTATFGRPTLTVSRASLDLGAGKVDGTSIKCGSKCSATFTVGQVVTLRATASSGSVFVRWEGDGSCTGSNPECTIQMDRARSVIAVFGQGVLLTVQKSGEGYVYWSGSSRIDCGDICVTSVTIGTVVTLVADPVAGWAFVGWLGTPVECTTYICTMTVTATTSITATFVRLP